MNGQHPIDKALMRFNKRNQSLIPIITKIVSDETEIPQTKMQEKTRKREVVEARQIAMLLSSRMTKASLAYIGNKVGGKDHATVLHARTTIMNLCETDKRLCSLVCRIINRIRMFTENKLVCEVCGEDDIEKEAMVNPNTEQIIQYTDYKSVGYCNKCKAHVRLINVKDYHYDEQHPVEAIPNRM